MESINDYLLPEYKEEFLKNLGRALGVDSEKPIFEKNKFCIGPDYFVHTSTKDTNWVRDIKAIKKEYEKIITP